MEKNHSNLWEQIGNQCLALAQKELDQGISPSADSLETVERLIRIAIAIDELNLQWAVQTRYGAKGFFSVPDETITSFAQAICDKQQEAQG